MTDDAAATDAEYIEDPVEVVADGDTATRSKERL